MMTEITEPQARALAALVHELRDGWDAAGTLAKLAEVRTRGSAWDIAHAALYAAEDQANRTPAIIAHAGPHWTRGKALGQSGPAPDMPGRDRCTTHDHERAHNCRSCAADRKARSDDDARQDAALASQGVPLERIRAIRAAADADTDAKTRAAGEKP